MIFIDYGQPQIITVSDKIHETSLLSDAAGFWSRQFPKFGARWLKLRHGQLIVNKKKSKNVLNKNSQKDQIKN